MDKCTVLIFLLSIVTAVLAVIPTHDYCWRDFKGKIPSDALRAGVDVRGKPLYIGQVLDEDKLIPGKIHEDDSNIYYEFGEEAWSSDKNIKIFCTKHPENFQWISATKYNVHQLDGKLLVRGGFQSNFFTYIGRTTVDGKTHVGKVICRKHDCLALYINDNGKYVEYHTFDILSYDTNSKNIK